MTAAAKVFQQIRHDDTLEQNFAMLLTELAVALRDLVANVNNKLTQKDKKKRNCVYIIKSILRKQIFN